MCVEHKIKSATPLTSLAFSFLAKRERERERGGVKGLRVDLGPVSWRPTTVK